jgi:hypothetical protein
VCPSTWSGDDCTVAVTSAFEIVSGICAIITAVLSFFLTVHELKKRGVCDSIHKWVIGQLREGEGFREVVSTESEGQHELAERNSGQQVAGNESAGV